METLLGGWNVLVGADKSGIIQAVLGRWPASTQRMVIAVRVQAERFLTSLIIYTFNKFILVIYANKSDI